MNEVTKTEHVLNVFDSENERWIEVTPEMQRMAGYVHQQILAGSLITAMALKKIKDEKLYLGLGCQRFDEYINTMLPFGRSTSYNYLKVANKLGSVFQNQLKERENEGLGEKVQTFGHEIDGLDFIKLMELTKLEDEDLKVLLKSGKVTINDSEISLDDIKDMTAREAAKEIRKIKDKYQERVDVLSETVKVLEDEKKSLKDTIDSNEWEINAAREKEKLFGAKASMYEHKLELLVDAEKTLTKFKKLMGNADINTDDAENLQKKFVDLIKSVGEAHLYLMDSFQEVTIQY